MAITKLVADSLGAGAAPNQSAFKNIIINGDMSIAQRGTSATGLTAGTESYYTVDRWQTGIFTTSAVFTQTQSTDVPSGQGFAKSLKMDCTTADASLASAVQMFLRYKIEGQNLQYLNYANSNAKSLTLSFWVKSNKTGTYIAEILRSGRTINKSYTVNAADTWEKKTITFAGDTGGSAISNNDSTGFSILFFLGNGSNMTSGTLQTSWGTYTDANRAVGQVNLADSTSNEWYITGVQLEAGTTASDFEFLPVDVTKQRCYRYFQKYPDVQKLMVGLARIGDTSGIWTHHMHYHTEFRTTPSLSYDDNEGNSQRVKIMRLDSSNTTTNNINAGVYENHTTGNQWGSYNTTTGLASYGDIGILYLYNLMVDAEL